MICPKTQRECYHTDCETNCSEVDTSSTKSQLLLRPVLQDGVSQIMTWVNVDDELPAIGEKVVLFCNGVVQEDIYEMDASDVSDYHSEYFWGRDDIDECPEVKSGQYWMRLPVPPRAQ